MDLSLFGATGLAILGIIGLLMVLQILPMGKALRWVGWVLLAVAFGPVALGVVKTQAREFVMSSHSWWVYIVVPLVGLVGIRLLLNRLLPWRRRGRW